MRLVTPFLLAAAAALILPTGPVLAGTAKEFDKPGVTWTLPDGWSFVDVSEGERAAGYFARAESDEAAVEVWAYAKPSEGLSLAERMRELAEEGGGGLGVAQRTGVMDTTLSGKPGKVVIQRIKAEGGAIGHFRKYVVLSDGTFYQLLVRAWHDAHKSAKDGINAVRAGFRLKNGAGGQDAPESMTELDGGGPSEDGASGDGPAEGGGTWPENGPKRDGRKVTIAEKNFTWTLPEDSPFEWVGAIDDAKAESGQFLVARARVKRSKQEYEKDTPDYNVCIMDLLIQASPPSFRGGAWVRGGGAQNQVVERWNLLDDVNASQTRTNDEVKFGNHTAAYIKLAGTSKGQRLTILLFATVLRGKLYFVRARCTGHTDAYRQLAPIVGEALRGIEFPETDEPVRGPLLGAIPDYAWTRGEHADRERTIKQPGFTLKKPEGLAQVKVRDSMNRDVRFVGEGRSDDGEAYLYFEIRTLPMNIPNRPNPREEDLVDKRAQDWAAGAGPEADLGRGSQVLMRSGRFGRAKGTYYEFTGHLDGEPVTEEGWVMGHKGTMYLIKMQYIGKKADKNKQLKELAKDLKRALRFD